VGGVIPHLPARSVIINRCGVGGATFVSPMIPMSYETCLLDRFSAVWLELANNWQIIAGFLVLYNDFTLSSYNMRLIGKGQRIGNPWVKGILS
jgi:hypothetical protein